MNCMNTRLVLEFACHILEYNSFSRKCVNYLSDLSLNPILSLCKKVYPHYSVLVGSRNRFEHDYK